jgi:hypothetical protein
MTGPDVPDDDMPIFSWPGRWDVSAIKDTSLSALLDQTFPPTDTLAGMQPVAEAMAALRAAPASDELAGEAAAMAEFRQRFGVSPQPSRTRRRRPTLLTSLLSARAAAVAAVAAISLGGTAAAAFTGALPAPAQQLAHDIIGAPAASHAAHPSQPGTPVGPNATGSAAFGLCNAWAHANSHARMQAVAFRNLVKAAHGKANVKAFCAAAQHPGTSASGHPQPNGNASSHPTGKPSALPTSSHPTGKSSPLPTPSHPTGKPTSRG